MKVAKIRILDGSEFYTNKIEEDYIRNFFDNVREEFKSGKRINKGVMQQIDILDMTEEEYHSIPVTSESNCLFL